MKPRYTLSPPGAEANINLAAKPKQVEAWLGTLPHGDPGLCGDRLADYLAAHNRPDLPATFRRQLLNLTTAPARRTLLALEGEFRTAPLPLEAPAHRQANRAIRLLRTLADGYKRLILEWMERRAPLFGENPLPEYLTHVLNYARQTVDICYQIHEQVPADLWRDIHQSYYFALVNDYANAPDPGQPSPSSPGDLYKAMLLEAIADPYHMSAQDRLWTRDIIARLGGHAQLSLTQDSARGGVYGIHIDEDHPPQPLSWQQHTLPDYDLILNNTLLARRLALLANQLENGSPADNSPLLAGIRPPAYATLLRRLKLQWGGSMQRHSPRHRPRNPAQCELVFGFHAICQHLDGDDGIPPPHPPGNHPVVCRVVNESLGGMAIENAKPEFRLKIGALVCVSRPDETRHDLGLVRWFKTTADGLLTFGIKLLTGRPEVIKLRDSAASGPAYPGLLLPREHGTAGAALTLVMPALGQKAPAATLDVISSGEARQLHVEEKLETAPDIDLFRCRDDALKPGTLSSPDSLPGHPPPC